MFDSNAYFHSLIHKPVPRKLRACLKCNVEFLADHTYGNRICGSCSAQNNRMAPRCEGAVG